ncbi:MAG: U32 family peptidase [Spirochaetia bacterium]|nr:U32 family peptidase [Spirochaetia bacterium]
MKNIELLAPAGTFESLQAAINAGCDSIYFGVHHLNMRARSSANFNFDDMKTISEICQKNNIKYYLTLNTLLYDHDLILTKNILKKAKEIQVSAVIAADTAAITEAIKQKIPVHISTQLSVSNIETVKFWSAYADTIVLARELDLKMIKNITSEIEKQNIKGPSGEKIKIEIFAHGALCIAISGRCGMSLYTDNSSANRGACKQPCRRAYEIIDKESGMPLEIDNEYVMSPKDICTIDFLDNVVESGVSVLKIEGRGRSPDYVDITIRCYKEALQALQNKTYSKEKINEWLKKLKTVYNRGFFDGYYLGGKKEIWSKAEGSVAKETKVFIGKIQKYFQKAGIAQIFIEAADFPVNNKVLITGTTTGVLWENVTELRDENKNNIQLGVQKSIATFPVSKRVRPGDKVYILEKVVN